MEKKNCYALFIGIDNYDNALVPNLSGCIKDAQHLATYIQNNLNSAEYTLHLKTLFTGTENAPTRQNIISHIRNHLGQATAKDMVLLFYAGHGSKEKAHPNFYEADGNFQTLVPSDARTNNKDGQLVKNILDKELRFLFYELWKAQQPELIYIQDSCHSTGATRHAELLTTVTKDLHQIEQELAQEEQAPVSWAQPVPRFTEPTDYEKSGSLWANPDVDALIDAYTAFRTAPDLLQTVVANIQADQPAFDAILPMAEHIHLAACDKHEFAYEIPNKGGVFTSNLVAVLAASQNTISYHDLFNRIRMNIGGVYQQTPDLFVNSPNFAKRHEIFLGNLLQHGQRSKQRDIDVFKGFYPLVPKGRTNWQIKAGELELLPSLEGNIKAIPIEVFLQDQQPIGKANAVIDYVASGYSQVTFTTANFDRRKHRNQLYAMVPPQYMRRWRVPVFVETQSEEENIEQLFEQYPPRKNLKNFQSDGGPAIRLVDQQATADFVLKAEEGWLYLYSKENSFLFKAAAIEYEKNGQTITLPFIQKPNDTAFYKYKKGVETPIEWKDNYLITTSLPPALPPIFEYLSLVYHNNPSKNIRVFCTQATQKNAFINFQETQQKILSYYTPFINWTTMDKAQFVIRTKTDGFAVYPCQNQQISPVPAFRQTDGLSDKDGFRIILALQKICKWRTVQNLYNKLQVQTLNNHQFEFLVKIYNRPLIQTVDALPDYNLPHRSITIQSWKEEHFQQAERGLTQSINDLQKEVSPIHFLVNPQDPSIVLLDLSLSIKHLIGDQNVYVSTLLLDSNYGVLPLQQTMGNNLLPPKNAQTDSTGTLVLNGLKIRKPQQMNLFSQEIQQATFYIKILIAYQRFDVSGFLQTGLPAPTLIQSKARNSSSNKHRAILKKPPKTEDTGSWLSFTIPLVITNNQ